MNDTAPPEHAKWFKDVHRLVDITEVTPGLPLPSIGSAVAAFNFTHITHAKDAAEAVALAETVLGYALHAEFARKETPRVGSAEHYVLEAFMPSGLRVAIVAKAEHMSARREIAAVAA